MSEEEEQVEEAPEEPEEQDEFQETEHNDDNDDGEGSSPCICMIVGCILFPLVLLALGYNEVNLVCTDKILIFADGRATDTACNQPGAKGDFIYFSCPLDPGSFPTWSVDDFTSFPEDSMGNGSDGTLQTWSAPWTERTMEVFACQEEVKKTTTGGGGGSGRRRRSKTTTTWTYKEEWTTNPGEVTSCTKARKSVCGSGACDALPSGGVWGTTKLSAKTVSAGKHVLPEDLVKKLKATSAVSVTDAGGDLYADSVCRNSPELGCVRASFRKGSTEEVAVFAEVVDDNGGLGKAPTPSSFGCSGKAWWSLTETRRTTTKAEALKTLSDNNQGIGSLIRIVGLLLAFLTVGCILNPIAEGASAVADCFENVPCVGDSIGGLIEGLASVVVCGISCICGCGSAICVIAIVWVVMRPLYGIGLMVGVLCCCGCAVGIAMNSSKKPRKKKKGQQSESEMQPPNSPYDANMGQPMMQQQQPMYGGQQQPMMMQQPMMQQPMMQQPMMQQQPMYGQQQQPMYQQPQ